jgi:hypothetical protein
VESSPPVLAHRRFVRLVLSDEEGFDGLGVVVVPCVNDGTSVTLAETPPAPEPGDVLHYDAMVNRLGDKFLMWPLPVRGGSASGGSTSTVSDQRIK